MNAKRIEELEQMLAVAYAQRTQAYKLHLPQFFTMAINSQIREISSELHTMKVGA